MTLLTDNASTARSTTIMTTQQVNESPEQEPQPTAKESQSYPSNLIVLLDIDKTMVYTQDFNSKAEAKAYVDGLPTLKQKDGEDGPISDSNKKVEYRQFEFEGEIKVCHINFRPGLKAFLQEVGTTFETHLFTAGSEGYAKRIARLFDPDGTLFGDRIWSSKHCQGKKENARFCEEVWKDVSMLPFDKNIERVVLIDDAISNLEANPGNMIKVKGFKDDPNDMELQSVLRILKDEFQDDTVDVRPILTKKNEEQLWFYSLLKKWRL